MKQPLYDCKASSNAIFEYKNPTDLKPKSVGLTKKGNKKNTLNRVTLPKFLIIFQMTVVIDLRKARQHKKLSLMHIGYY